MKISVPSNCFKAPTRASMLGMSRCVVGSSISSRFGGSSSSFTSAVRSYQNDLLTTLCLEIHPGINHVRAIGLVNILEADHLQSAPLRLRKTETNFFVLADRRLDLLHALDLLEFALRLRGLGVL